MSFKTMIDRESSGKNLRYGEREATSFSLLSESETGMYYRKVKVKHVTQVLPAWKPSCYAQLQQTVSGGQFSAAQTDAACCSF